MTATLKRLGKEWGVVLPDEFVTAAGLTEGSRVTITPGDVLPDSKATIPLDDLLAQITDENRHELIDFGPPVGNEVW
jgi:antitoxin MazE